MCCVTVSAPSCADGVQPRFDQRALRHFVVDLQPRMNSKPFLTAPCTIFGSRQSSRLVVEALATSICSLLRLALLFYLRPSCRSVNRASDFSQPSTR